MHISAQYVGTAVSQSRLAQRDSYNLWWNVYQHTVRRLGVVYNCVQGGQSVDSCSIGGDVTDTSQYDKAGPGRQLGGLVSGIPLGFSDCLEIPDMSGAPDLTRSGFSGSRPSQPRGPA